MQDNVIGMNPNKPAEENAPISSQASYNAEVELFRVGYNFEQFSYSCE